MSTTYTWNNFKITATYTGSKAADWGNDCPTNWNHHRVTVTNQDTGKRTCFDFWASLMQPELRTRYDVLNAFRCFVDDALCGSETFEDFCSEFGYNEDSRRAEKTWKACKRSLAKLQRIYPGDLYDLINELEEYA